MDAEDRVAITVHFQGLIDTQSWTIATLNTFASEMEAAAAAAVAAVAAAAAAATSSSKQQAASRERGFNSEMSQYYISVCNPSIGTDHC